MKKCVLLGDIDSCLKMTSKGLCVSATGCIYDTSAILDEAKEINTKTKRKLSND